MDDPQRKRPVIPIMAVDAPQPPVDAGAASCRDLFAGHPLMQDGMPDGRRAFQPLDLPIVESNSGRVAGGFCSTRDALSLEEETILKSMKKIHGEARKIKQELRRSTGTGHQALQAQLDDLRQQGRALKQRKEQATAEKHARLGHVTLPVK